MEKLNIEALLLEIAKINVRLDDSLEIPLAWDVHRSEHKIKREIEVLRRMLVEDPPAGRPYDLSKPIKKRGK